MRRLKVGDILEFKAATRSHYRKAKRVIVAIDDSGLPMVRYHGWNNFVVRADEIISSSPPKIVS